MEVKVTQQHIVRGFSSANSCPIALALQDAVPESFPTVSPDSIAFSLKENRLYVDPDGDIIKWINKFDNGKLVKPITIHISLKYNTAVLG